jgi:hypothetical protein
MGQRNPASPILDGFFNPINNVGYINHCFQLVIQISLAHPRSNWSLQKDLGTFLLDALWLIGLSTGRDNPIYT